MEQPEYRHIPAQHFRAFVNVLIETAQTQPPLAHKLVDVAQIATEKLQEVREK